LTSPVLENSKSTKVFEFPPIASVADYKARGVYLAGFESISKTGDSAIFGFILSNGDSSQKLPGSFPTPYKHMIPASVIGRMSAVIIEYSYDTFYDHILGFTILDRDGSKVFRIGLTSNTTINRMTETIQIPEGELIVGVKAKIYPSG